jgi:acyl carrier protein
MNTIEARVVAIIRDHLNTDPKSHVLMESRLIQDLGADSLEVVEIVMAIEEEFDVQTPCEFDEVKKFKTVGDIVDWITANEKAVTPAYMPLSTPRSP